MKVGDTANDDEDWDVCDQKECIWENIGEEVSEFYFLAELVEKDVDDIKAIKATAYQKCRYLIVLELLQY